MAARKDQGSTLEYFKGGKLVGKADGWWKPR
jgi:hypothetical protein